MVSEKIFVEQFGIFGIELTDDAAAKCLEICITQNIMDEEEFVEQFMSFSLNNLNGALPTPQNLSEMERKIFTNKKDKKGNGHNNGLNMSNVTQSRDNINSKGNVVPMPAVYGGVSNADLYGGDGGGGGDEDDDMDRDDNILDSYICKTPKAPSKAPQSRLTNAVIANDVVAISPATYSPISNNKQTSLVASGSIVCTFGNAELIKSVQWAKKEGGQVTIRQIPQNQEKTLCKLHEKYMFDPLVEQCQKSGDNFFDIAKEIYTKEYNSRKNDTTDTTNVVKDDVELFEDLVYPDVTNQDAVRTVGRIYCDTANGKLDMSSVMLVGTDDTKIRSVRLSLETVKPLAIIPGQVVMLHGRNPRGDTFYVREIHQERALVVCEKPKIEKQLSFIIAAGPFTLSNDITYEPLSALLVYLKQNKPDVMILMGPFLDSENELIVDGIMAETFDSLFDQLIVRIMEAAGSETHVAIVSSYKDCHGTMIYPTNPYTTNRQYPNLTFLPDPCIVDVNGIQIACTSTDIYSHIQDAELINCATDPVRRIVNYLFHQGTFYPINPPPLDISIDMGLLLKYGKINRIPNVIILPSDTRYFIRDINDCLAFNPGRLANENGGTFGRFIIAPPKSNADKLLQNVACQVVKV